MTATATLIGVPTIHGVWIDLPEGHSIKQIVGAIGRVLVGAEHDGRPEISWVDSSARSTPFPPIPPPRNHTWGDAIGNVDPWIELDLSGPTTRVSVTRIEYQGGSFGMVVFPDAGATACEEIESPTDSDIAFGRPVVVRGDEVFTFGAGGDDPIFQYRRRTGGWTMAEISEVGEFSLGWAMALSTDGQSLLVAATNDAGSLQLFRRDSGGLMRHVRTLPVASEPSALAFRAGNAVAAFETATATRLAEIDLLAGTERHSVDIPPRTPGSRVTSVTLADDVALAPEEHGVQIVEIASGRVLAWLEAPPSSGDASRLLSARMQTHVAIAREGSAAIGVFDLTSVLPP